MKELIEVLGIQLGDCTAKEVIRILNDYMNQESVRLIKVLTAESLVRFTLEQERKEDLEQVDLVLAGDHTILEAAGVEDKKIMKAVENYGLIQVIFHYFHKNSTRMFLLADEEEHLAQIKRFFEDNYQNIQIVGSAIVPAGSGSDDMIINQINGTETEVIMANITSVNQEAFISRCRSNLSVRVWVGISGTRDIFMGKWSWLNHTFHVLRTKSIKRKVEKEKKKRNA